jgi:hypothetical protein
VKQSTTKINALSQFKGEIIAMLRVLCDVYGRKKREYSCLNKTNHEFKYKVKSKDKENYKENWNSFRNHKT